MASTIAEQKEKMQAEARNVFLKQATKDSAVTEQEYDQIAPYYHQVYQHHAIDIGPFMSFADLQPGQKVLDLGCGAGWITVQAACRVGLGGQVTAVDACGGSLRQTSTAVKLLGLQNFIPQANCEQCFCHLATYLSPGGLIVFSQDHEYHELACIDALPFDGSDTDELHWLIGDARGFKQTCQLADSHIRRAGLVRERVEDCYQDDCYGYQDCTAEIHNQANRAWQRDGGVSKECSRLYLEHFKREEVTKIMNDQRDQKQNVAIKHISVLVAARQADPLEKVVALLSS